ncbi:MAG: HD domain-containing protein [Bacteroidota bacterium]
MNNGLIKSIADIVSTKLRKELNPNYYFHNYKHTVAVVRAAYIISFYQKLNLFEQNVLFISAWLHDIGYLYGQINHEETSAKYAEKYLLHLGCSYSLIAAVQETIRATHLSYIPNNKVQSILKDADLYHLSQLNFFTVNAKLKREIEVTSGKKITESDWHKTNINFFERHQYFSKYGKKHLIKGKRVIYQLLKKTKLPLPQKKVITAGVSSYNKV